MIRTDAGLDTRGPADVYALCEQLGVTVQFVPISMEGIYKRGKPPRILLSAMRPAGRKVFTCGHELGHHVFGHAFTVDQILEQVRGEGPLSPQEYLVQVFAGFLLMPALAARRAFTVRNWSPECPTPAQVYTIACSFGVGYTTLIYHLAYSLHMLADSRARELLRVPPARIRRELIGQPSSAPLVIVDESWVLPTVDAEVGTQLLLPKGTEIEGNCVEHIADLSVGRLFEATKPGIARVVCSDTSLAAFVRISRRQYVGLARYRHLEDNDPDLEDAEPDLTDDD